MAKNCSNGSTHKTNSMPHQQTSRDPFKYMNSLLCYSERLMFGISMNELSNGQTIFNYWCIWSNGISFVAMLCRCFLYIISVLPIKVPCISLSSIFIFPFVVVAVGCCEGFWKCYKLFEIIQNIASIHCFIYTFLDSMFLLLEHNIFIIIPSHD